MARFLCVVAGVLLAGCAAATQEGQQTADISAKPIPPEFTEQVRRAELLGRALYRKDILAARATDALMARGSLGSDTRVGGWVTVPDGEKWTVYFFDRSKRAPAILHEVNFPDSSGRNPAVREPGSRPGLEKTAVAMFKAREAATKVQFQKCSQTYNSVVLPAELAVEKGWYVYLLAATTQQNLAVMGGHVRVHISADGTEILNVKEFTKSCISQPIKKGTVGLIITHLVDKHPIETHVFMSLLYGMPLYVGISPNTWAVENGSIRLVSR